MASQAPGVRARRAWPIGPQAHRRASLRDDTASLPPCSGAASTGAPCTSRDMPTDRRWPRAGHWPTWSQCRGWPALG